MNTTLGGGLHNQSIADAGFVLGDLLGEGGSAQVFEAMDREGRRVAIKRIPARSDLEIFRSRTELEIVGSFWHPNIVALRDYGWEDDTLWIAMECGIESLSVRPPTDVYELRGVCIAVLNALSSAHARGIFHRDLKPGNLIWSHAGSVRLADFGVAWREDHTLGVSAGTPGFMAPEQAAGDRWDHGPWTDLYALGRMVERWWPEPSPRWAEWIAWLTHASPAHRPRSAGEALSKLPVVVAGALQSVRDARTLPTLDESVAAEAQVVSVARWESGRLPDVRPSCPRRVDMVHPRLLSLVSPPLMGRDELLTTLWSQICREELVRVDAQRGMGSTAILDEVAESLERAGAMVWRIQPSDDPLALLQRITRSRFDPNAVGRWVARRGGEPEFAALLAQVVEERAPASVAVLERALQLEPGPRVLLAERPGPDLARMLPVLHRGEVPVSIVWFGAHEHVEHKLLPLAPSALEGAVTSWVRGSMPELHLRVGRAQGRPGWFFRGLQGWDETPEDLDDPALTILAWWPAARSTEEYLEFCAEAGLPVDLRGWTHRGLVSMDGSKLSLVNAQVVASLQARVHPAINTEQLAVMLSNDGERARLFLAVGDVEQAVGCWLRYGKQLSALQRFGALAAVGDALREYVSPSDSRYGIANRYLIAALHHLETRQEDLEVLVAAVLEDRGCDAWENAVNCRAGALQRAGRAEEAVRWLQSLAPLPRYLQETLAAAMFDAGDFEGVEEQFQTHPLTNIRVRAEAALMRGDSAFAEALATEALARQPKPSTRAQLLNLLGAVAVEHGELPRGERLFREAAAASPGLGDSLQPLTNATAVAAMRGHSQRARRDAELLLPRLERVGWRQNVAWTKLVLWATVDDPDEAEAFGAAARDYFGWPQMDSIATLARLALDTAQQAERADLVAVIQAWLAKTN